MQLNFFLLIITTWLVSQTIKYVVKVKTAKIFSFYHLRFTFLYASGPPSSHTSLITASLLYLKDQVGLNNPLFSITTLFSLLWLYEIYMQRKRYRASTFFLQKVSHAFNPLNELKELSGHDLKDIFLGLTTGTTVYFTLKLLFELIPT